MSKAKFIAESILSQIRKIEEVHMDGAKFSLSKEEETNDWSGNPTLTQTVSFTTPDGTRYYLSVDVPANKS